MYTLLDIVAIRVLCLWTSFYIFSNWLLDVIIPRIINRFLNTVSITVVLASMWQFSFRWQSLRLHNEVRAILYIFIVIISSFAWRLNSNLWFSLNIGSWRSKHLLMLNYNWLVNDLLNIFQNLFSFFVTLCDARCTIRP